MPGTIERRRGSVGKGSANPASLPNGEVSAGGDRLRVAVLGSRCVPAGWAGRAVAYPMEMLYWSWGLIPSAALASNAGERLRTRPLISHAILWGTRGGRREETHTTMDMLPTTAQHCSPMIDNTSVALQR